MFGPYEINLDGRVLHGNVALKGNLASLGCLSEKNFLPRKVTKIHKKEKKKSLLFFILLNSSPWPAKWLQINTLQTKPL